MPEGIEVELYREAATALVGRTVGSVDVGPFYVRGDLAPGELAAGVIGASVEAVRRVGKVLLLDLFGPDVAVSLALRFGMTGRLVVDGVAPIDRLLYTASAHEAAHVRFSLGFVGGGEAHIVDPRRLGSVELDPDETLVGPDAFDIRPEELLLVLRGGRGALKSRLLDQRRIGGIGNLICDETLWRCAISPVRPAGSLDRREIRALATGIRSTIALLARRGGSHTGDLQEHRQPGEHCPRDGELLERSVVGGRTTYWCPAHQL